MKKIGELVPELMALEMNELIFLVVGILIGALSFMCFMLMASNTMYEEKLKKVKTNEDMLRTADSEHLRKVLKRMCWQSTMYLSPLLREAHEKRIDEWLEKEADPEWKE